MGNRINVAELLKDCPKGIELDCYLFKGLEFDHIDTNNELYPIVCRAKSLNGIYDKHVFTKHGCYNAFFDYSKCVIFPKGKTTWEGFIQPCKFKDGDIVATNDGHWIGITKGGKNGVLIPTYCITHDGIFEVYLNKKETWRFHRLATEEEKRKLFDAIKDNGYKWNPETKTLEKLITPKFKVGDRVKHKNGTEQGVILSITDDFYDISVTNNIGTFVPIANQDKWELVPNKFDITTSNDTNSEKVDNVNHPKHYTWLKDKSGIEVIDITRHMDFCLGNAIKYILRAGHKQDADLTDNQKEIEDLKKAIWYINDRIKQLGGEV